MVPLGRSLLRSSQNRQADQLGVVVADDHQQRQAANHIVRNTAHDGAERKLVPNRLAELLSAIFIAHKVEWLMIVMLLAICKRPV